MTTTRRGFFKTLFRSVATAAALSYAPSVLRAPEPEEFDGTISGVWTWHRSLSSAEIEQFAVSRGHIRPSKVQVLYEPKVHLTMDYEAER